MRNLKELKALHNDLKTEPFQEESPTIPEKHEIEVDFYEPVEGITPVPSRGRPGEFYHPVYFIIETEGNQVKSFEAYSGDNLVTERFALEQAQKIYDHYKSTGKFPTYESLSQLLDN